MGNISPSHLSALVEIQAFEANIRYIKTYAGMVQL